MREVLWRDSGIAPKIGPIDARAIFPLALWLFHMCMETTVIAAVCVALLFVVQRTGMSPVACLRLLRLKAIGVRRESAYTERQWRSRCRW